MDAFAVVLVGVTMVIGIVGTLLPFLPGLPIVWAAALVYGLAAGFGVVGWAAFSAITVLAIVGMLLGAVLPHRRATEAGAPRSTVVVGLLAGIVGFFLIPIIGLPIGAALGVMLMERRRLDDWGQAWTATKELMIGFGIGALIQAGAGVAMMACWIAWVWID